MNNENLEVTSEARSAKLDSRDFSLLRTILACRERFQRVARNKFTENACGAPEDSAMEVLNHIECWSGVNEIRTFV
jgi:RIO-like serine/threonine protein kinase